MADLSKKSKSIVSGVSFRSINFKKLAKREQELFPNYDRLGLTKPWPDQFEPVPSLPSIDLETENKRNDAIGLSAGTLSCS